MRLELNVPALKKYLKEQGMTYRQLAKRMGVSYVTLYRVMTGRRNPGNEFVAKILKACDLEFSELFIFTGALPKGHERRGNSETS